MLNIQGILILIAFGIWVNLIMDTADHLGSIKEILLSSTGPTFITIVSTYIVLVVVGLFIEGKDAEGL